MMGGISMAATPAVDPSGGIPCSMAREVRQTLQAKYLIYLPKGYDASVERYPLLYFLHGAGEHCDNLDLVKKHGPMKHLATRDDSPFIILVPQCPAEQWWSIDVLLALLDEVIERYAVDTNRVYLTGLSMGGFGTWMLACEAPEHFAAAIPICGGGNRWMASRMKDVPTWAFHGAKDRVVPLRGSREMVQALKKSGGHVRLTIYPDADHDSWTQTYNNPAIYDWLLQHSLKDRTGQKDK